MGQENKMTDLRVSDDVDDGGDNNNSSNDDVNRDLARSRTELGVEGWESSTDQELEPVNPVVVGMDGESGKPRSPVHQNHLTSRTAKRQKDLGLSSTPRRMKLMEKFQAVLDLHLKHHSALGYGLVTLLTAGGERIFSAVVFQCPCSAAWNLSYGLVFLLVPALALFLPGLCAERTHVAPDHRLRLQSPREFRIWAARLPGVRAAQRGRRARAPHLGGRGAARGRLLRRSACASTATTTAAAELPLVPCHQAKASDVQDLLKDLKAQSQVCRWRWGRLGRAEGPRFRWAFGVLGWILIAAVIIILLIFTCVSRCLSPVSFLQLKFWKIYLEKEQQILKSKATEHATELAKENVKCFFEGSHPKECNTPSVKEWQQISSLYTFNQKDQYYSMLHKYVNRKDKTHSIRSAEGDTVVPVLGFVDSSGINSTLGL
ncbi:hypothetical protein H8959_010460 [Pygathrix nigripes]